MVLASFDVKASMGFCQKRYEYTMHQDTGYGIGAMVFLSLFYYSI
jgi:hypothetical protein